ncbi:hypothetical protein D5086_020037 [Populus alba]|uniref:Uncharacterized protein n=1 Tax=Populus alba TaxID=43335 RepID=A0ACC4BIX3_POPAL
MVTDGREALHGSRNPGFTSKAQHDLLCNSIHGKKSKNRIGAQQESPPKVLIQIASTKLLDRLEPKTRIFNGVLLGRYWNSQLNDLDFVMKNSVRDH